MNLFGGASVGQPLRVPRVTQEFFPVVSGPANQALAISRELEWRGIVSPILTTTAGEPTTPLEGVTVHRFQPMVAAPNFRPSLPLQRMLLHMPATLFHVHGWRNPVSDGAILAAWQRGIPLVVQAHGVAYGYRYSSEALPLRTVRRAYDALMRPVVTRAAALAIAGTQLEAEELRMYGFPADKIVVIPVGVDEHFFSMPCPAHMHNDAAFTLLTVGRLGPRRSVEQIIRALALLRAWGIPAHLRVVGPEVRLAAGEVAGYRQQLEALAYRLGVAHAVTFTGPLHGQALRDEYRAADVFVYTTLYENFGQPMAEAAASGLPLVATPTGVAPELVGNDAGFLVPFHDAIATATALQTLYLSPEHYERCRLTAQHRAAREFRWATIGQRYCQLYTEITERNKPKALCYG